MTLHEELITLDDFIGKPALLQLFSKLAFLPFLQTREGSH